MKYFTKFSFLFWTMLIVFFHANAQISFINQNSKLTSATHSGCSVTVVDVNGDGLDDIVRLDEGRSVYIAYQRLGQQFQEYFIGDFTNYAGWAWGMCVADVDHNGIKDVLAGGYGPSVKIMKMDNTGSAGTVYDLPTSNFFLQNANFADINSDGWEDVFGCDDDAESHIWLNDGTGDFFVSSIIDFDVTNTDDSGNYGSVWTDFDNDHDMDLYIAKCRQGINSPGDGRRIDVLFVNDGNDNYTEDAISYGLNDSAQTWTANFADIDNDGDLDCIQVEHDVPSKLLLNDGTGHYSDISANSGFDVNIYPIESVMEDFDNDGFVDILVTGSDYLLYHNNGDHTFTYVEDLFDNYYMASFAVGDLNHDGKIDIYASYAELYTTPTNVDDVYWMNTTDNDNHFITLNLKGTISNEGALGARAMIYGEWGTQMREVHAGESYGTCNSFNLHFGLGASTVIDSIVVSWPSGLTTSIIDPAIDQFITIEEDECVSPNIAITYSGDLVLCSGETIQLVASGVPSDYTYSWSTGATTPSIMVSAVGDYYVSISSSSNDCSSTSALVHIDLNPDETPVITASGDVDFCEGGSVVLSGPASSSYTWSNGSNTQSITVTQSGTYTLTTAGVCQSWTSDPIEVTVLPAPAAPITQDDYINGGETATLTATGNNISWYNVSSGGSPIATGNTYNTPPLTTTTAYYAEDANSFNGDTLFTGQLYHEGSLYSASNSTNSYIIFDVFEPCVLKSAKVYTDVPGDRLIELRKANGDVIQSIMIDVPVDSPRITLNFNLTPGTGFQLGTNTAQNNVLLGYDAPHLQRSNSQVTYPYVLQDLVSLNGSDQGSAYYYYFYDWEVEVPPVICPSDRTPATAYITTGISSTAGDHHFQLFPNPTEGMLTVMSDVALNDKVNMQLVDVAGKMILQRAEEKILKDQSIQFDLSSLPKGVYFFNIQTGENQYREKVVIQ